MKVKLEGRGKARGGNLGTFAPSSRRPGADGSRSHQRDDQHPPPHRNLASAIARANGRGSTSPSPWRYLAGGTLAALVFGFILPPNFIWLLAAIPHEMGHATFGCLLGHPSAPAISLSGHAWTGVGALQPWLVWAAAATMGLCAAGMARRPMICGALATTALLIPLCAFTGISQILIAAGGHVGELAFATWCFTQAWTGGQTDTPQERVASAMAGALLQFTNLRLCFGLLTSAAARSTYASSGSLGLKNDYLVLAEDLLGWRLGSVALIMLVVALLPLPLGILFGAWRQRIAAAQPELVT